MNFFHVHTYRCQHAEDVPDEIYILKAIEHGADSITFTDHAPFPNDPFHNRMRFSELPEYVSTLHNLKEKYKNTIEIKIGLEIEFLPSFIDYYKELRLSGSFDILMLGQHFYEKAPGIFSFNFLEIKDLAYRGLLNAAISGIETGLFDVVAHPDRAFRKREFWDDKCTMLSKKLIDCARQNNVILEQNFSSMQYKNYYWQEFWDLVPPENQIIQGIDAHNIEDLDYYGRYL